jgi:hypothetical protein
VTPEKSFYRGRMWATRAAPTNRGGGGVEGNGGTLQEGTALTSLLGRRKHYEQGTGEGRPPQGLAEAVDGPQQLGHGHRACTTAVATVRDVMTTNTTSAHHQLACTQSHCSHQSHHPQLPPAPPTELKHEKVRDAAREGAHRHHRRWVVQVRQDASEQLAEAAQRFKRRRKLCGTASHPHA